MDTLEKVQAIIETAQKRPVVSLLCLMLLLLIVFSPVIISVSSNLGHQIDYQNKPIQPVPGKNPGTQRVSPLVLPPPHTYGSQPSIHSSLSPALSPVPGGFYFIVVASKPTQEAAVQAAKAFEPYFPAEVYLSPNGWYAVTVGRYTREEAFRLLETAVSEHRIPSDAWLSNGKTWLGRAYP